MAMKIDIRDLPDRFAELVARPDAAEDIIVTDGGTPKATLSPLPTSQKQRLPGLHAGAIQTTPDFDAPLPDEFWSGSPRRF